MGFKLDTFVVGPCARNVMVTSNILHVYNIINYLTNLNQKALLAQKSCCKKHNDLNLNLSPGVPETDYINATEVIRINQQHLAK